MGALRLEAPMTGPATYSWYAAYKSAIIETDLTRLYICIDEVLSIIDQRLTSAAPIDREEDTEIQNAVPELHTLIGVRLKGPASRILVRYGGAIGRRHHRIPAAERN